MSNSRRIPSRCGSIWATVVDICEVRRTARTRGGEMFHQTVSSYRVQKGHFLQSPFSDYEELPQHRYDRILGETRSFRDYVRKYLVARRSALKLHPREQRVFPEWQEPLSPIFRRKLALITGQWGVSGGKSELRDIRNTDGLFTLQSQVSFLFSFTR